jgi:hypothetical protein
LFSSGRREQPFPRLRVGPFRSSAWCRCSTLIASPDQGSNLSHGRDRLGQIRLRSFFSLEVCAVFRRQCDFGFANVAAPSRRVPLVHLQPPASFLERAGSAVWCAEMARPPPVFLTDRDKPYADRERREGGQIKTAWNKSLERTGILDRTRRRAAHLLDLAHRRWRPRTSARRAATAGLKNEARPEGRVTAPRALHTDQSPPRPPAPRNGAASRRVPS